jgi:hypothetical protein
MFIERMYCWACGEDAGECGCGNLKTMRPPDSESTNTHKSFEPS